MLVKLGRNSKISKFSFSSLIYHFWEKITKMLWFSPKRANLGSNWSFGISRDLAQVIEVKFQNHPSKDPSFRWIFRMFSNSFRNWISLSSTLKFMSSSASCWRFFSTIVFSLILPAAWPLISGTFGSMLRQVSGIKYLN